MPWRTSPISIHALRKESDRVQLRLGQVGAISIHALRKESDPRLGEVDSQVCEFQSTLSVRRATCGESAVSPHLGISIHALRKESDHMPHQTGSRGGYFNPRSP